MSAKVDIGHYDRFGNIAIEPDEGSACALCELKLSERAKGSVLRTIGLPFKPIFFRVHDTCWQNTPDAKLAEVACAIGKRVTKEKP